MQIDKSMLAAPLLIGLASCSSMNPWRQEIAVTPIQPPARMIPAECYAAPEEPRDVEEPSLEALPDPAAVSPARLRNAERAGLYWRSRATVEREARENNAATQTACSTGLGEP